MTQTALVFPTRDERWEDIGVIVRYIHRIAGELPAELVRERIAAAAPSFEETMASIEEQLIRKGLEQGLQQGRIDALRQALARLLCASARSSRTSKPALATPAPTISSAGSTAS